jgi:hypothetical protein
VVRHERRAEDHRATEVVKPGGEPLGLPAPPVTPELALPSFVSGSSRCCGAGRSSLCLPRRVLRRGGRGLGPLSASRAARPGISPRALTPTRLTSCGLALAARTARGRVACRRHELRTLAPPRVFPTEPPPFWSPRRCRPRSTPRGRARRAPLGLRPGREGPRRARLPRSGAGSYAGRSPGADSAPAGRARGPGTRDPRDAVEHVPGVLPGRPLPSARRGGSGIRGSTISHCSSVRFTSSLRLRWQVAERYTALGTFVRWWLLAVLGCEQYFVVLGPVSTAVTRRPTHGQVTAGTVLGC